MPRSPYTHAAALLAILVLGGVVLEALMIAHRSRADDFIFLTRAESAEWLRADRPMKMGLMEDPAQQSERTQYRKAFSVDRPLSTLTLRFRAMTQATVTLNGAPIFEGPSPASWKTWRTVKIAPLPQGDYTLVFDVTNPSGPALVQAVLPELDIATDTTWHTRSNDKTWTPARSAHTIGPAPASRAFSRSDAALFRALPYLLPAVVLVLAWRIAREGSSRRIPAWLRREPSAAHFRWGLLAAFVALAINNFFRVPVWFGFDIVGHMEYIHYVAELRTLPLAPEGWKMNEAPLFYLVSALPYSLFYRGLSPDQNILVMRVIPMLCGVAQIEIAYRTAQYAFPKRDDAQIVATAVSALIPMHLYLTQFPSNQPFVALWSSLVVLLCYRRLHRPEKTDWSDAFVLGVLLGLALLSKVTAILMLPVVFILLGFAGWRGNGFRLTPWPIVRESLLVAVVALLVCGWYYLRNLAALGVPFSVGFSHELGTVWRQDPGFRSMDQFLRFGEALWYPVHAGFVGWWDSLYSTFWSDGQLSAGNVPEGYVHGTDSVPSVPPWNFRLLGAATLLSTVPMALIVAGVVHAVIRPESGLRRGHVFAVLWLLCHLAGMLYLYLSLPAISAGKAAYLLNILPCFGVLAAQGWNLTQQSRWVNRAVLAGLTAWAAASYAAFFAR